MLGVIRLWVRVLGHRAGCPARLQQQRQPALGAIRGLAAAVPSRRSMLLVLGSRGSSRRSVLGAHSLLDLRLLHGRTDHVLQLALVSCTTT